MQANNLLNKRAVLDVCAISHSTLYRMIKNGAFPEPVRRTGQRGVGWRADEVEAWILSRPRVQLADAAQQGGENDA
jgi:prophage regulatory protein